MILLWGEHGDPPLDAVAAELKQRQTPHVVAGSDSRVLAPWSRGAEAVLEINREAVALADISAVYLRPRGSLVPSLEERECAETLLAWADMTSTALVVNRPAAMASNLSKPFQARLIAQHGLPVPETLVTTDPKCARAFIEHHDEVVYKSVSGVRSIVRRITRGDLDRLEYVVNCPTQFQRYIPGRDIRVHVVGNEALALVIDSSAVDYRYAQREGGSTMAREIALTPGLAEILIRMVASMGLAFAGVDLRQTPCGQIYCLEVNPSPGFTYYERLAGVRLADRLVSLLSAGTRT